MAIVQLKFKNMPDKKQPGKIVEMPKPQEQPEVDRPFDPAAPVIPEEEPEMIPYKTPVENPAPTEMPGPGES